VQHADAAESSAWEGLETTSTVCYFVAAASARGFALPRFVFFSSSVHRQGAVCEWQHDVAMLKMNIPLLLLPLVLLLLLLLP